MKTPEDHTVNQYYRDAADSESSNTQDDRSESVVASEADSLPSDAVANKQPVTDSKKLKKTQSILKKELQKKTKLRPEKSNSPKSRFILNILMHIYRFWFY